MNKFWERVLINIGLVYLATLIIAAGFGAYSFLIAPLVIALLELFVAVFLLIAEKTRPMAQVMMAAAGIVLLIGLAVCSVAAFSS